MSNCRTRALTPKTPAGLRLATEGEDEGRKSVHAGGSHSTRRAGQPRVKGTVSTLIADSVDAVFFQQPAERAAILARQPRRHSHVAARFGEHRCHVAGFELGARLRPGGFPAREFASSCGPSSVSAGGAPAFTENLQSTYFRRAPALRLCSAAGLAPRLTCLRTIGKCAPGTRARWCSDRRQLPLRMRPPLHRFGRGAAAGRRGSRGAGGIGRGRGRRRYEVRRQVPRLRRPPPRDRARRSAWRDR